MSPDLIGSGVLEAILGGSLVSDWNCRTFASRAVIVTSYIVITFFGLQLDRAGVNIL